jgi:hypothetical protein
MIYGTCTWPWLFFYLFHWQWALLGAFSALYMEGSMASGFGRGHSFTRIRKGMFVVVFYYTHAPLRRKGGGQDFSRTARICGE